LLKSLALPSAGALRSKPGGRQVLVADDERDYDDSKFAYMDDDAGRWSITYLGEFYPLEFINQGKMDAEELVYHPHVE
jgi:hypothetical protein